MTIEQIEERRLWLRGITKPDAWVDALCDAAIRGLSGPGDGDKQDAERYRFLRDHSGMYSEEFHILQLVGKEFTRAFRWGRRLDDEVDEVIKRFAATTLPVTKEK